MGRSNIYPLYPRKLAQGSIHDLSMNRDILKIISTEYPDSDSIFIKYRVKVNDKVSEDSANYKITEPLPASYDKKKFLKCAASQSILVRLHFAGIWAPDLPIIGLVNFLGHHCLLISCLQHLIRMPDLYRLVEIVKIHIGSLGREQIRRLMPYESEKE